MIWNVQIKETARKRHPTGEEYVWDHRFAVRADGKNLIGHAGVRLLRKVADRVGLATALIAALPRGTGPGWRDQGTALVQPACAIVLGATNILEAEQLQYHWRAVFGRPASESTLRRAPAASTPPSRAPDRARPRRDTPRGVDAARPAHPAASHGSRCAASSRPTGTSSTWTRPSSPEPAARKSRRAPSRAASVTCR